MYKCNFTETLLRQMVEQPVTNTVYTSNRKLQVALKKTKLFKKLFTYTYIHQLY